MIILAVTCRARIHETDAARAAGCVCPVEWGKRYRPPARKPQRVYVPGRTHNRRGPTRLTVTEPDEIAVERAAGGDRSLVLAKVERDAAIDLLDRYRMSARDIALRLGVTVLTVQRRRAARRAEASR